MIIRRVFILAVMVSIPAAFMPAVSAEQIVEILMRGHYYSAPATVQIAVAVEPDEANRLLRIEADGDRMYRATEMSLEGEREKRVHVVEFKNLPPGEYEVRAEVLSSHDVRGLATQELLVTGAVR